MQSGSTSRQTNTNNIGTQDIDLDDGNVTNGTQNNDIGTTSTVAPTRTTNTTVNSSVINDPTTSTTDTNHQVPVERNLNARRYSLMCHR